MLKIGLSGNRCSGKDLVCNDFRKISVPVFEADTVMRFIINYDNTVRENVKNKIADLRDTHTYFVSLKEITDKEDIDILIDATKIELFKAYSRFCENNNNVPYTIFHSSILFEKKWEKLMDYSISVFAPKIFRMERYKNITSKTMSDIANMFRYEIDDLNKNKAANFIVHNYNGADVMDQVRKIDDYVIGEYIRKTNLKV